MLIILPLLTFLVVFLDLLGLQSRRADTLASVRGVFLQTAAFIGAYVMVFSEGLSLFKLLTQPWAATCWGLALLVAGWLGWRKSLVLQGWRYLRTKWLRPDRFDLAIGASLAIVLLLLYLVAVVSPPNNNDSLLYHMSRVMHWAQDHSLSHFATGFEPQLYNPIWAETAILNARLLWGNDRLANLIQWGSLIGALVGVSAIAKLLGAGRRGQWISAAFAASLPMTVLQATSTQNDLVTAFWLVSLLYFVVLSAKRDLFLDELLGLACVLGVGLVTKATFYPYAVLPMLYFIVQQFLRQRPFQVILRGMLIASVVLVLNLGYWVRNIATFSGPFGPSTLLGGSIATHFSPGTLTGSVVRNVFLNLVTPKEKINAQIIHGLQLIFQRIDPGMANYRLIWAWNHEDSAGNPLHVLLILLTLILLILLRRRLNARLLLPYVLVVLGSYILLSAIVLAGPFDGRYQLPFFVTWAPLFGVVLHAAGRKWVPTVTVAFLLVAALPWVLFNRTRPLIAMRASSDPFTIPCLADCTAGSILNEPPARILFAGWTSLQEPDTQATRLIREAGCRSVSLQLDSHDLEYTFWWLLEAPQSGIRIERSNAFPELERYVDPNFKPCAIICTICQGQTRLHGLDLVEDLNGVKLFMGPDYNPIPNQ